VISGIHHVAISTPDLDRSVAFYRDVLGFELKASLEWDEDVAEVDDVVDLPDSSARLAMMFLGNVHIEIFEWRKPRGKPRDPEARVCDLGITHICLHVSDLDAEFERMKALGVEFHAAPQTVFGTRTVYGHDPDGNAIELQEILGWEELRFPDRLERVLVDESVDRSGAS
jgi:catechol 2,3-dioxygenase-like lactoylglutathione lyase family enzyme